jgi:osmotically-inducible protein OsmY
MKRTDAEIKQLVTQELKWDARVKETDVGVQVKDGIVTLTGTLSSYGERQAAANAVHRVSGVRVVANDLNVKLPGNPERNDTEVASAVRHTLEWNVFLPAQQIITTVSDGWVTLEGRVDLWSQRQGAEDAIRNLTGVAGVINKLEVKPSVFAGDVRRAIEEALERRAIREASHLQLDVKQDGHVKVTGVVGTWAEKKTVLGAVRGTSGVRVIDDEIRIA